jgi:glycosyltransferase involved in cell wall biosynthesis
MSKQSVDILLPFWGDVDLFKMTVNSVLAQTNSNWRLLIFDDHYPSDEPKKFIDSLADGRIVYYRHKKNIGITPNFNFALSQAEAPYFVMIGCDDILLTNYVETALNDIESADFYQPRVEIINKDGDIYTPLTDRVKSVLSLKPGEYNGERLATSLCNGNWLYFPSILWRTEMVKAYGFDNKYKIAEDLALELQLILDGKVLKVGKEVAFQYRRFSQSLSSKEKLRGGVRFNEEQEVYKKYESLFKEKGWHKASLAAKFRITSRINEMMQ